MSAATRRTRLSAPERRAEILAAAVQVFGERGYHGSSLELIAREAGISKALIYEHFASKRELHSSLLEEHVGVLFARLQGNAVTGTTGEARLRGGVEVFLGYVQEEREVFRLLFRDMADPEVAGAVAAIQAQSSGLLVALMLDDPEVSAAVPGRTASERARAIELLAVQLAGALQALATWWHGHQEVPREELVDRAVDFAWTGLRQLRDA